jgi:hypothetical protein
MDKVKESTFLDWIKNIFWAFLFYFAITGKWLNGLIDQILYYAYDYEKYGYGAVAVRFILIASFLAVLIIILTAIIEKLIKLRKSNR